MTSVGEKTVVYEDRVVALKDVSLTEERGCPLGIENDEITGGKRQLFYQDGHTICDWQKPQHPMAISNMWANVDGRLGAVMVAGSGLSYNQATKYQQGMAVYPDILYGSFSQQPRKFKVGEEVAHRIVIFYVETTPKETATLAKSFKIENQSNGTVLHLKLAGGGHAEVPLL
jgi:hypothetical protein